MQPNIHRFELKKRSIETHTVLIQAQVSVAHFLCLGRDSSGLTDLAGGVWRCTFRWWEQTAAFLFCHLTFWWGDVSPAPGRPGMGGRWVGGLGLGCLVGFSGVHAPLERRNWAQPLPAVSASTVTTQSYFVNPNITSAFSSAVHCNPGYTALKHSPCMVQF